MNGRMALEPVDWSILADLSLGSTVLQFGYGDGTDTASLARTANLVIAAVACPRDEYEDEETAYDRWYANVISVQVNHKTMAVRADWPAVAEQFVAGSFGLVFVHPPYLGALELGEVLDQAQRLAPVVVVTADELPYRAGAVVKAASKPFWNRQRAHGLWVMRYDAVFASLHERQA